MRQAFRISIPWLAAAMGIFLLEVFIGARVHDKFVRPYLGDVLVVVLLHAFLRGVLSVSWKRILAGVLVLAFAVEGLQAIHLGDLLGLRPGGIPAIVLGSQADLKDLVCYLAGGGICLVWERVLGRRPAAP